MKSVTAIAPVSNDGETEILYAAPYVANVTIEGVASLLFHRWSNEAVKEKSEAAKNSKSKKTDNVESYLWRCENGHVGLPGEYLRMAIIGAAKFRQDPRSPRKSAMDLFKAGVMALTEIADLGVEEPDYEDHRRAVVQRSAITRVRPAMRPGWRATIELQVVLPEYIEPATLNQVIQNAGKLIGVGDFRPTFGRFVVVEYSTRSG
ncbi:MAG: hypothetical protein Q7O66_06835 [Dehalococcoidia bacterium]|nr:hypothetical protein [Dehalococcoidia bacterium]